jgi:hypothetical protein
MVLILALFGSGAIIWGVYWLIKRAPATPGNPDLEREEAEVEDRPESEDASAQVLRGALMSREQLLRAADRYDNSGDTEGAAAARKAAAALENTKTSESAAGRRTEVSVDFGSSDNS